jgi:RNA repair pathway DNA polymerase beta family
MNSVVYRSLRGSHAQGVTTPTSDKDYFEIVLPPIEAVLGLQEMVGSQHIKDGLDTRTITLKEFLRQALHGRSTELEVLFARPEHQLEINPVGRTLLENRHKLVSRKLYGSLTGFYKNQKYRMFMGNGGRRDEKLGYDPKMAAHCVRAIWQLINLKTTGDLSIFISDPYIAELIVSLKEKRVNILFLQQECDRLEKVVDQLDDTKVQEEPDYRWASNFLIGVYQEKYCSRNDGQILRRLISNDKLSDAISQS